MNPPYSSYPAAPAAIHRFQRHFWQTRRGTSINGPRRLLMRNRNINMRLALIPIMIHLQYFLLYRYQNSLSRRKKKKNRNIRVFAHQHESSLEGRGRRSRGPLFQVRSANREEQERRESNYIHHRPTILVLVINLNLSWEDGYAFSQDDFKAKRNPRQEL